MIPKDPIVGNVGQNEELYEDPVWPVVVASRFVQSCNLVVFVQVSQAPATRGKDGTERVLRFRTLFENCVKAGDWLTWCSQSQAVVW